MAQNTTEPCCYTINRILDIMRQLRDPTHGCPWDREQTFTTIAPYTIEEAYEVADAIAEEDWTGLKGELGDLLFQVVFHAQLADEAGYFNFSDVIDTVSDKMTSRHPHVFGDAGIRDSAAQSEAWENHKAHERAAQGAHKMTGALDGVAKSLPALTRAIKLQNRAARVGFDWPETTLVLNKMREEMAELSEELVTSAKSGQANDARILDEFGDLLFVYANLARHIKIDPEEALRHANAKFERRFRLIENRLRAQGRRPQECGLDELETLWCAVKAEEKAVED